MKKLNKLQLNILFILLSFIGGYIFSLSGAPIGWLLGSLISAWLICAFGFGQGKLQGIHPFWRQLGQAILGIELAHSFKVSIIHTFEVHFILILITVLITIIISILSGVVLWRFSSASMMTCLFGSTPGGISAMPSIAEEVGANTLVVSIMQTLRILLVVGLIPLYVESLLPHSEKITPAIHLSDFTFHSFLWTVCLIIGGCGGALIWKKIKMPAPWLIGSMLGAVIMQLLGTLVYENRVMAYWPPHLTIFAQILIGTSIGSRIRSEMFKGLRQIFIVSLVSTLSLVLLMISISAVISEFTHIPLVTCILAFAPGGVAEMSTAAVALHADSTFVLAVQTIRLMIILILLPPLFRFINNRVSIHSAQQESMDRTN